MIILSEFVRVSQWMEKLQTEETHTVKRTEYVNQKRKVEIKVR